MVQQDESVAPLGVDAVGVLRGDDVAQDPDELARLVPHVAEDVDARQVGLCHDHARVVVPERPLHYGQDFLQRRAGFLEPPLLDVYLRQVVHGPERVSMLLAEDTDEAAQAKWQHYRDGADVDALAWMADQGGKDAGDNGTAKHINLPEGAVNFNMGTLVGSYASVARMLDEVAEVPDTGVQGEQVTVSDGDQPVASDRRWVPH